MSAEIWNVKGSDILCGGQCVEDVLGHFPKSAKHDRMIEIWKRWHLNDSRASCEHQRAEKWEERPIDPSKPTNVYGKHFEGQKRDSWNMATWVRKKDWSGGLMCEPCSVCGYEYGSAWLKEELPANVIAEIESWNKLHNKAA